MSDHPDPMHLTPGQHIGPWTVQRIETTADHVVIERVVTYVRDQSELGSAVSAARTDVDGNALVTVRVDDLKVGLPTWATGRAATAVRRLRRALDERGES